MKHTINLSIGLALLAILFWNPLPFKILELKTFDWLMSTSEPVQDEMILLVDLDEEIVEAYQGYPLPRTLYSDLIERVQGTPGITVLMPDPDIRGKENDFALSNTMSDRPTVLAYAASTQADELGPHVGTAQIGEDPNQWLFQYPGILRQTPVLAVSAEGVGVISSAPELDGVVRRLPVVVSSQDKLYPSFALEMLRVGVRDPSYQINTREAGVEWIRIPNYPNINTDANGRIWITSNIKFYRQSAAEFLRSPMEGAAFVIFGVTAEGVVNPVPTAGGSVYPHEIQANVLHHLINGTSPVQPVWADLAELGVAVIFILLLLFTASNIYYSLPVFSTGIGGLVYSSWYAYQSSYLIDVSGTIVIGFLFWAIVTFRNFLQQYFMRMEIKKQFGTYVSPDLVRKLQSDPSLLRLGGVTKRMTFLFSDIRGFTPISEKYQSDPQKLVEIVNKFLTNQTNIILEHEGCIDKYMGDCIMAFWNAPLDVDEQEKKATECALQMRLALKELNDELEMEGCPKINTGVGINTGLCVVGNMGSDNRFDYSVLGDAVNLAARLESACKTYDTDLIISEYSLVEGYNYDFLDEVTVKGKSEPVKIYTIQK